MTNLNFDCHFCNHHWLRHGEGKATEGGKCNQCNKQCLKFTWPPEES